MPVWKRQAQHTRFWAALNASGKPRWPTLGSLLRLCGTAGVSRPASWAIVQQQGRRSTVRHATPTCLHECA